MAGKSPISISRLGAIVLKEFVQMKRDRMTFGMMIGIPLLQLVVFGFAINSNPKNLPTGILAADHGPFGRTIAYALVNSGYFSFDYEITTEREAHDLLEQGVVQFVLNIPEDFTRRLIRGENPDLLLEADATDPAATGNAIATINRLVQTAWNRDLKGPLASLRANPPPVDLRIHAKYNPEAITQYNIVPGLMGIVLTMTMVMITALAITRERERGTMENLLATPVRPVEVITGKILPYVFVGYVQVALILILARLVFGVPMIGSISLLLICTFLFIAANLAVGITFSTIAKNQLQAVQMTFFFFLPSILLSGFMFPFRGMPVWAQGVGSVLPLTHFLRIVRGILLKGNGLSEVWHHLWPILIFVTVAITVGIKRYRQTLD
jgi:ABC-2 type transport system permease protein